MAIVAFNSAQMTGMTPGAFANRPAGVPANPVPIAGGDLNSAQLQGGTEFARDQFASALQATAGEAKPGPEPLGRSKPSPNPDEDLMKMFLEHQERMRPFREKEMERRMNEMMRRAQLEDQLRR